MSSIEISIIHNGTTYSAEVMRIRGTSLGMEDHGIWTGWLHCEGDGTGTGIGGYCLDTKPDEEWGRRVGSEYGLDWIMQVCKTVGVEKWEDLRGKAIYALYPRHRRCDPRAGHRHRRLLRRSAHGCGRRAGDEREAAAMTVMGFTGTRNAPSGKQLSWLANQIREVEALHHGACVGADACAHIFGLLFGVPIVVHPPVDTKLIDTKAVTSTSDLVTLLPAKPYHDRNRDIVDACDQLIALPNGPQRPHSGTWYTVGYATGENQVETAHRRVVPVTICYPDGTLEER